MDNATASLPPIPELGMGSLLHTAGALLLVLLVLWAALWMLRRFGPFSTRRVLAKGGPLLRERLMLGNRQSVVVVEVQGRRLLLGVTEQEIRLLTELDGDAATVAEPAAARPAAPAEEKAATENFEDLLAWSEDDADSGVRG